MSKTVYAAIGMFLLMVLSFTAPISGINEMEDSQLFAGETSDPTVTLLQPTGGEVYSAYDLVDIQYTNSELSGSIDLEFTTDGSTFSFIANKIVSPSTSFYHEWTVPNTPTTTAQIRITSTSDSTITDISNYFTILGESEVERDYDCEDFNGFAGPVWASGTVYYIGDIVEHPADSGEFWMVEEVETVNFPLDGDWEGPCSCRDIWNGTKDTWNPTSTYFHYKIVYHDRTYYYANDDTPAGKIPGGIDWWIACGDAHACDNLQGQVSQYWNPTIAGPSPQIGPGYSRGDMVTILDTGGLVPNVWVSNVDQNHAYPTESKTNWQTGWDLTTVDSSHLVGHWPGIDLDSNDNIHISYFDDVNDHLKYAMFDGTSWIISVIDTSVGGHHSSLVVDSNDHIHIAYADNANNELKYAVHDGNSWTLSVVGPARADSYDSSTSITVDANNNPHISYFDKITPYSLMYSAFDGTTWTTHTVDNTAQHNGVFSEIAVDSTGGVHISYTGPTTSSNAWYLKYANYDGTSWSKTTIGPGIYSSIAIDSNDNPRIAYGKQNGYGMGEYRLLSGLWVNSYIYQGGILGGQHVALVIDDDDVSHIASRRSTPSLSTGYALVYSTDISGGWETDVVDTQSGPIRYSDIALDSQGYPHIAYTKWGSSRSLGHAGPSLTEGNNWTKCNCSDLAEPWVPDVGGTGIVYDALSVVSHNGVYWMSSSDHNGLEPGSPYADWVLCVDGNPCENKTAGEDYSYGIVYGMGNVVEHPMNSGNYWVSLQTENAAVPSDTATQWWWPCSCEDLASGSWQTENEYQQWQVVEWEGTYWIALVDHSSTAADSPDIPGGADYWKPCETEFCTSTGWWDAGMAVSGLYDTGVVVSHPYPNDDRWISMIDDNQWLPIVNGEFWLRCNVSDPIQTFYFDPDSYLYGGSDDCWSTDSSCSVEGTPGEELTITVSVKNPGTNDAVVPLEYEWGDGMIVRHDGDGLDSDKVEYYMVIIDHAGQENKIVYTKGMAGVEPETDVEEDIEIEYDDEGRMYILGSDDRGAFWDIALGGIYGDEEEGGLGWGSVGASRGVSTITFTITIEDDAEIGSQSVVTLRMDPDACLDDGDGDDDPCSGELTITVNIGEPVEDIDEPKMITIVGKEVAQKDVTIVGGTAVGTSVLWLIGRRLLGGSA